MLSLILTLSLALTAPDPHPELPPLALAQCLPSDGAARAQIDFAARYRASYSAEWQGHWCIDWNLWYWRAVREAHDQDRTARERRTTLASLVDWLGWEAVLCGRIPPAVPLDLIPSR